jgi:hypothetical protein
MMTDALNYLLKMLSGDTNDSWTRAHNYYKTHGRGALWVAAESYSDFLHSKVALKYITMLPSLSHRSYACTRVELMMPCCLFLTDIYVKMTVWHVDMHHYHPL